MLLEPITMTEHRELAAELTRIIGFLVNLKEEADLRYGPADENVALMATNAAVVMGFLGLTLSDQMVHDRPERARPGIYLTPCS